MRETSARPTALRMPLDQLIQPLASRDISILIDGAHAPGQIALDVGALLDAGVTWYAGNNHKWLCGIKGSGFLAVSRSAPPLRPVITSHGASAEKAGSVTQAGRPATIQT